MVVEDNGFVPEDLEEEVFEGNPEDGDFTLDGVDSALKDVAKKDTERKKAVLKKASKKRKKANAVKKKMGIRPPKQSKFPTRAHDFIGNATSDRAINVVLNNRQTEIYKDGADICPRILMGIPAFGKKCKKNAFMHLIAVQEKLKAARGENPKNAPGWIIINNDTSMIMDRNLLSRLEDLKETTHMAAAYGYEDIKPSGKWYMPKPEDQPYIRGCYVQGDLNSNDWDFIVGSRFKHSPRYRIIIGDGPFVAVRGETFMQIDFSDAAANMKKGFFHYGAEISMECLKRGQMVAQVKTISSQYDDINDYTSDPDFQHDQSFFASKWQPLLPNSINPRKFG